MIPKILYIAGSGRSGSTILDNILGQLDGFASVGEVRFVWERGVLEDRTCACGEPFSACPFWRDVMERVGGLDHAQARYVLTLLARGTRARRIPRMLGSAARRERFAEELGPFRAHLTGLYDALGERTGARVLVDSSKLPTYGWWLDRLPGADLRVVHLTRDPRATAYSWRRRKELPDKRGGGYMQQQGPLKASGLWTLWNATAQLFWRRSDRYMRVRYEDLIREPEATVRAICAFADEPAAGLPFVADHEVVLQAAHSIAGNPSRFTTGRVRLRADDEWRSRMSAADRVVVTSVTWPLLLQLGYASRSS